VSRLARQHVKVVLSGDGGDEIFAGYERYRVDQRRRQLGVIGDLHLGAPLRALSAVLPVGGGRNTLHNLSLPRIRRYLDSMSLFPGRSVRQLFGGRGAAFSIESMADPALDPLSQLQDLDIKTYLPGDILTKVDRMSMANSLEARVPLLDHRLVEFACALPASLRMRSGVGKYLLKRALRGRIPAELLTRPKQGFGVPLEAWFSGSIPGFFRDQLGDGGRLATIGIERKAVQELHDLFEQTGRRDYCERLWALVVLDRALQRLFGPSA
jgi:asparagine synthase (glutamine-hydrolysing)